MALPRFLPAILALALTAPGLIAALDGAKASATSSKRATAVLAGGCYWSLEADLDRVPGVVATTSGYTRGELLSGAENPLDRAPTVAREAVRVEYDPSQLAYRDLLDVFWRAIDPTDAEGQSCDRGRGYTTAIYVANAAEREIAEATRAEIEASGVLKYPVVTPILGAAGFSEASATNQDFYVKSPERYRRNRLSCLRDYRIKNIWGEEAFRGVPGS